MQLPSKIIDISMTLDNETVSDPEIMRPHIEYRSGADNAEMVCEFFPGLKPEDLPDGKGWSWGKLPWTPTTAPTLTRPIISIRSIKKATR